MTLKSSLFCFICRWALNFAPGILGGLSAATGVFINHYYRKKLKLGRYGHFSTYLPIVVLPALSTVIFHRSFVQHAIILNPNICPVCIETRSCAIQGVLGIGYPTVIAPLAAFMFATRHYTYRLPSITEEPIAVLKLWKKLTMPISGRLALAFGVHMIAAIILTYKEMENLYTVQNKLIELEERLENAA